MSIKFQKVNSIPVIFLAGLIFLLFSPLKIFKEIEAIGLQNTRDINAANQTNEETLKVWFTSTKETGSVRAKRNEVYEEIIAEYNRQATVKVEREVKPSDGWIEEIKQQGKSNNLPCIFELDAPISYEFIEKGWLTPINLPDEIKQDLMPPILEQGTEEEFIETVFILLDCMMSVLVYGAIKNKSNKQIKYCSPKISHQLQFPKT